MIFTHLKNKIIKTFETTGYSRTAEELLKLSDRQLDDLGISKALLKQGAVAFPWRSEQAQSQQLPMNVSKLVPSTNTNKVLNNPDTPKAA